MAFASYNVSDLKRAREFYEHVLNLKPTSTWIDEEKQTGFVEYSFGPNEAYTLAIGKREGVEVIKGAGSIENYEEAVKDLKEKGVVFTMDTFESDVCFMSLIADPDENQIMIHKRK